VTDSDLIVHVLTDDDRAAFGTLVRRHQSAVRNFLRHLAGGDAALADDLAQKTFLQAYHSLAQFRGDANFLTWLLGIARNHHRNARRQQRDIVPLTELNLAEATTPSPTRAADLGHDLALAIRQLSPGQQTVLHLCYQQGLTHNEAAAVLDCPLGTVKTHLARAKDELRQLLAAWNPTL
jgi:RNA polymerase sigma-70 factor (ECF subfamily)